MKLSPRDLEIARIKGRDEAVEMEHKAAQSLDDVVAMGYRLAAQLARLRVALYDIGE